MHKQMPYTQSFKLAALKAMHINEWPLIYASVYFDLSSSGTLNQEVVCYEVRKSVALPLVTDMLKKAISKLSKNERPIIHSDQGWQYQNQTYQTQIRTRGLSQIMSRKGNGLNNAVAENFFGILKTEMYHNEKFRNADELIEAIKEYIEYYKQGSN